MFAFETFLEGSVDKKENKDDFQHSRLKNSVDVGAPDWDRDHQRGDGDEEAMEEKRERKKHEKGRVRWDAKGTCGVCVYPDEGE